MFHVLPIMRVRSGRSGDEAKGRKDRFIFFMLLSLSLMVDFSICRWCGPLFFRISTRTDPKGGLHHTAQSVLLPTHSHTVSSTALIPHLGRCRLPINRRCWMDAALAHTAQMYAVGPIFPNNLHPVRNITSSGARRKSAGRSQEFCYHKNTRTRTREQKLVHVRVSVDRVFDSAVWRVAYGHP